MECSGAGLAPQVRTVAAEAAHVVLALALVAQEHGPGAEFVPREVGAAAEHAAAGDGIQLSEQAAGAHRDGCDARARGGTGGAGAAEPPLVGGRGDAEPDAVGVVDGGAAVAAEELPGLGCRGDRRRNGAVSRTARAYKATSASDPTRTLCTALKSQQMQWV